MAADWCDKQSTWEGLEAHIQIKSIMQLHKRSVGCRCWSTRLQFCQVINLCQTGGGVQVDISDVQWSCEMTLIYEFCLWPLRGSLAQSERTCFTKHSRSIELTEDEIASAFIKLYDFPQAIT